MELVLNRVDDGFHLEAQGSGPLTVSIDAAEAIGGNNNGARPMELVLMGLASCGTIDLLLILKKQKQIVEGLKIIAKADRAETVPKVFTKIHLAFQFKGDLNEKKVLRALDLSFEKYCSVSKMIESTADITYSFTIN